MKQVHRSSLYCSTVARVAINWAQEHVPAIIEAWYPGEEGGTAIAEALFGGYNPGGRLPVTFYRSVNDLPSFEDYHMAGRTYRYFTGEPLYPFGYGLSYTHFHYSNLTCSADQLADGDTLILSVDVTNVGEVAGDEVIQVYVSAERPGYPLRQLAAFQRLHLAPKTSQTASFLLNSTQFTRVGEDGIRGLDAGTFTIAVGGGQPEYSEGVHTQIEIKLTG